MSSRAVASTQWMAYIGLGANLPLRLHGEVSLPEQTVRAAVQALAALGTVAAVSSLWRTAPVGPVHDQPEFVNAAAILHTQLGPKLLLDRLLALEQSFGRVRGPVDKGPRTLDLDLLLMEQRADQSEDGSSVVLETPRLQLPHPEMDRRRFVLAPLAEIAPDLRHPLLGVTVQELLLHLDAQQAAHRLDQSTQDPA